MTFIIWSLITLVVLVMFINTIVVINRQVSIVASFYGD